MGDRLAPGQLEGVDLLGLSRGHVALMTCCEVQKDKSHLQLARQYRHFMAAGGCIWQASDSSLPSRILKGVEEMSFAVGEKLFNIIVLSGMDNTILYGGDFQVRTAKISKNKKPTILYQPHDSQIAAFAYVFVLNLGDHMETIKVACTWANDLCKNGHLPELKPDITATKFNLFLRELGMIEADPMLTNRDVDEACWTYLFKRKYDSRTRVPRPPMPGHHGSNILARLARFPVCTISGDPGAGKSRDVPPSILGTLLSYDSDQQVGIPVMLELKDAQHSLYEHMTKEHPLISPWISIWNGDPGGHKWPRHESFIIRCNNVSFYNRLLGAKRKSEDVT